MYDFSGFLSRLQQPQGTVQAQPPGPPQPNPQQSTYQPQGAFATAQQMRAAYTPPPIAAAAESMLKGQKPQGYLNSQGLWVPFAPGSQQPAAPASPSNQGGFGYAFGYNPNPPPSGASLMNARFAPKSSSSSGSK